MCSNEVFAQYTLRVVSITSRASFKKQTKSENDMEISNFQITDQPMTSEERAKRTQTNEQGRFIIKKENKEKEKENEKQTKTLSISSHNCHSRIGIRTTSHTCNQY